MRYFAYGSNMDPSQMYERCPSAMFVGIACLADHRLAFTRYSTNRRCGVADVVAEMGRQTWGVVFEIDESEKGSLDSCEGYECRRPVEENAYVRQSYFVWLNGDSTQRSEVSIYIANKQLSPPRPSKDYKNLILKGARHWQLPADYLSELEEIETA